MIRKSLFGAALVSTCVIGACRSDAPAPTAVLLGRPMQSARGSCIIPKDVGTVPAGFVVVPTGFDEFGYNDCARNFVGAADGSDRLLDGKVWGDATYANDRLVMKWNEAWDQCNAARSPANCAGAWEDNEWNGKVPGGSGEVWHYKIRWSPVCAAGETLIDGGYCIWGEYEVLLSQGTVAHQHLWDVLAKRAGYGK